MKLWQVWGSLEPRVRLALTQADHDRGEWLARKCIWEPRLFTPSEDRELRALIAKARFLHARERRTS